MASLFPKVNRIMKHFKKWTEGDITDIADKDEYKKILQALEQLGDNELKIFMLRYVKLAFYPEEKNALIKPTLEELAEAMQLKKTATQNLLGKAIYAFYGFYKVNEAIDPREKVLEKKTSLEKNIEHFNERIHFYQEWIKYCERSGLPKEHPNHRYFLRGLEKQEQWLVESKDKLKALLGGVECKN